MATVQVPDASWGWRECEGCGCTYLAPASRTRCKVCREPGTEVVRLGRGVAEEDDGEGAEVTQPMIDWGRIRAQIEAGEDPARVCLASGVTVAQFVTGCYRNSITWPGAPTSQTSGGRYAAFTKAVEAAKAAMETQEVATTDAAEDRDRIERIAATMTPPMVDDTPLSMPHAHAPNLMELLGGPPAPAVEPVAPPEAEPVVQANPFRAPTREGGIVIAVRIEGSRIVILPELQAEGDITDFEVESVLAFMRDRLSKRRGAEVVIGS